MPLADTDRAKLDSIVQQMHANGEQDSAVQSVVDDFKQKYGGPQDSIEKGLNYHTGNDLIDAPLGVAQGAVKGLIGTVAGGMKLYNKLAPAGAQVPIDAERERLATVPNGIGQGTGKFLENAAEFALPAGEVAGAMKGAGLAARLAGQAAVGAGVAGVQSGGDPTAAATGAAMGAGGELLGAAAQGVKKLVTAKAPTLANFSESFGNATPTQKARISKALPTLEKDGIPPADDVHAMQDTIKGKIDDLSNSYDNLDPAIRGRQQPAQTVIQKLQSAQQQFTRRGVVTDDAAYNAIQNQIDKVSAIAAQNKGAVDLDDLIHLKQTANGRTNFTSPDADKSLWKTIGNAYRSSADTLAPEVTPLNRDYQHYKDLEQIIDQNIDRGKGVTPSGLDLLLKKTVAHGVGASSGAALGGSIAGAPGAAIGGLIGGIAGPRLAKSTMQALQNAADAGQLTALSAARRKAITVAARMGDNAGVMKMLGVSQAQAAASSAYAGQ